MKIETRFSYDDPETRVTDYQIDIILDGDSHIVKLIYELIKNKLIERGYEEW